MKKYILLPIILFVSVLSHAQYDFLKESLKNMSTGPSYLVVKVKSPSYEGEAAVFCTNFHAYYKTIKYNFLNWKEYWEKYMEEYMELAYYDIKHEQCFIVSDEVLEIKIKDGQFLPYYFEKIIVNDSVLDIAKKGIEFFIHTYFNEEGILDPPQYVPNDFNTIVKVMFDAGIRTGIGSEYSHYYIQDERFYIEDNGEYKFVIPIEYRDNKQ